MKRKQGQRNESGATNRQVTKGSIQRKRNTEELGKGKENFRARHIATPEQERSGRIGKETRNEHRKKWRTWRKRKGHTKSGRVTSQ